MVEAPYYHGLYIEHAQAWNKIYIRIFITMCKLVYTFANSETSSCEFVLNINQTDQQILEFLSSFGIEKGYKNCHHQAHNDMHGLQNMKFWRLW